jgi:NADH-dependent peroxiredoxin subunit F
VKIDPVCGKEVDEGTALKETLCGDTYYFCSEECRSRFLDAHAPKADKTDYDLIVIGGGPAGLTAAVYASILKIDAFLIACHLGGQAVSSTDIENYMGFDFITGPELVGKFEHQLFQSHYIAHIISEAERISAVPDGFNVRTSSQRDYRASTLIVATGMTRRTLGVPGEEEFQRRGLFYGNIQDASYVEGEDVVVVGGGNSAMQIVENLESVAKSIAVVCRGKLTADAENIERVRGLAHVRFYENHVVEEIKGQAGVEGVLIRTEGSPDSATLPAKGVFVSIGLHPNSSLVEELVDLNEKREIVIDRDCSTSRPGVFAAGDVTDAFGKRIVIASGEGAKAALATRQYLLRRKRAASEGGTHGKAKRRA